MELNPVLKDPYNAHEETHEKGEMSKVHPLLLLLFRNFIFKHTFLKIITL